MHWRSITLFFVLLMFGLSSCHKEQSPKAIFLTNYYKGFWYGYGSYWVFFDQESGSTDSIVCIPSHITPFAPQTPTDNIEQYSFSLLATSTHLFDTTRYYWGCRVDAPSSIAFYGGKDAGGYGMNLLTNDPPSRYEQRDSNATSGYYYYYKSELLASLIVNGITYDSVYRITGKYNSYYSNTVCLSRKNGFILMDINDNTGHKNLTLLRSRIVQ